ncbi:MAG: T9SS type A sorting domain-containing protein, partial [Bacteroidia bacterium]
IYDVSQIGAVAFIQDDFNKIVEQAANSAPLISTGINKPSAKLNLAVYPNPFSRATKVFFPSEIKNGELKIFDTTGRQWSKIIFSGKQIEIKRRNLPAGIYFLEAQDGEKIFTKKLIIQ